MNQREEHRSLYLSYLECCNEHDVDRMATSYTSTMKVNDVLMDRAAVAAQFPPLFSAFPDWHWEMRNLVVDRDYTVVHFAVTGTHRGTFQGIEATGRRVTISEFTFYRLEDGKFADRSAKTRLYASQAIVVARRSNVGEAWRRYPGSYSPSID